MKAKKGHWVRVHFTGTLQNGAVFDSSPENEPLEFQIGSGILLPDFENHIIGMTVDEEKMFQLLPEKAFGKRDEEALQSFSRQELPEDLKDPQEGQIVQVGADDGQEIPGKIRKITGEEIIVDLNHPLAGETLVYNVKLLSISNNPSQS